MLLGTNDLEDGGEPEQIAENIRQILGMIRTARPQTPVILCKVMPSSASKKRPVEKIRQVNSLLDGIIKADPLIKGTLVAMVTARGQVADGEDARRRGADAYFIKPFSPLQVVAWVRGHGK